MQDLTKGSISQHLIKTASFMLVTMVFQTLYFLVDLYWVGRLGKEAVAGVGVAGNLTFIVLAISQMLGVGTTTLVSHAAGRKDHERALLVFNQSQVLSMLAGGVFLVIAMIFRVALRDAIEWRPADRGRRRSLSAVVSARDGLAVLHRGDELGAPRHRQLQARDGRADEHRHHQHHPRADSDLRVGHRHRARCERARRSRRSWQ